MTRSGCVFIALLLLSLPACSHRLSPTSSNIAGIWDSSDSSVILMLHQAVGDTIVTGYGFIRLKGPNTGVRDSLPLNGSYHDSKLGLTLYAVIGNTWPVGFIIGTYSESRERISCTIKNMAANVGWQTELVYQPVRK